MPTKKVKLLNDVAMKKKTYLPEELHMVEWVGDHPIGVPVKPTEEDETYWGMVTGQSGG